MIESDFRLRRYRSVWDILSADAGRLGI